LRWRIPKSSDEVPPGWWGAFVRRAGDVEYFVTGRAGDQQAKAYQYIQAAADAFVVSLDIGHVPAAARNQRFIEAEDELYETIGRIVIGDLPVSAYDAALDAWYRNGGTDYVRQMQEYIKSVWEN
jgi:putative aldouronate transport system substrate-binding protein